MRQVIIPIIVFVLLTALSAPPARALMDNFYITMPPDTSRCIAARLPLDLYTLAKGYYTLETVSDFPVNLGYIRTFAEAVNIVKVPICFYSQGRQDGDFAYYTIRATALEPYNQARFIHGGQ